MHANALAVAGAESYYRNMFFGDELTWNLRDGHFLEVLQLVEAHLRCVHSRQRRDWMDPLLSAGCCGVVRAPPACAASMLLCCGRLAKPKWARP